MKLPTLTRAAMRQRKGLARSMAMFVPLEPVPPAVLDGSSAPHKPRITARASGSRGLYSTWRWRRYAEAYLIEHPVCECEDRCGQPSAFVDHRVPITDPMNLDDPMTWDPKNHQALSDRCHRLKSRIELGQAGKLPRVRRKSLRIKGCDANGRPLDPEHPWNKE